VLSELYLQHRRLGLRLAYHATLALLLAGALIIGLAAHLTALVSMTAALIGLHVLTFRRLTLVGWLERAVLKDQGCPTCGGCIDLNDWWRCSCGYTGLRHVLAPCPACGKEFAWLVCQVCETGIVL